MSASGATGSCSDTNSAAGNRPIFAASMTGRCHSATVCIILRATVAIPLAALVVSVRIRRHGVQLWARGLPLVPRPAEHLEEYSR
ncbi:DUF1365 family protein [Nocardia brasiliensis]|uniref:DUF1365 family protein n=2 Tax=Nocardia brasiliensis TaxID=37326 RepID=UPI001D009DC0|nr:DUF1365 family protein [Nocardia brasiliensis]